MYLRILKTTFCLLTETTGEILKTTLVLRSYLRIVYRKTVSPWDQMNLKVFLFNSALCVQLCYIELKPISKKFFRTFKWHYTTNNIAKLYYVKALKL